MDKARWGFLMLMKVSVLHETFRALYSILKVPTGIVLKFSGMNRN